MAYRAPKTLAAFLDRDDLSSADHVPVAALLAAAAKDPARYPEIGRAWAPAWRPPGKAQPLQDTPDPLQRCSP